MGLVQEGQRHRLKMGEHRASHIEDDPLRQARGCYLLQIVRDRIRHNQDHEGDQDRVEWVAAGLANRAVHRRTDEIGNAELSQDERQNRGDRAGEFNTVGTGEFIDAAEHVGVEGRKDLLIDLALRPAMMVPTPAAEIAHATLASRAAGSGSDGPWLCDRYSAA